MYFKVPMAYTRYILNSKTYYPAVGKSIFIINLHVEL